jgi:hypothetical protein
MAEGVADERTVAFCIVLVRGDVGYVNARAVYRGHLPLGGIGITCDLIRESRKPRRGYDGYAYQTLSQVGDFMAGWLLEFHETIPEFIPQHVQFLM